VLVSTQLVNHPPPSPLNPASGITVIENQLMGSNNTLTTSGSNNQIIGSNNTASGALGLLSIVGSLNTVSSDEANILLLGSGNNVTGGDGGNWGITSIGGSNTFNQSSAQVLGVGNTINNSTLGIVIGTQAKYVTEGEALNHVAGYCIVNDVSERSFQMATTQWDKGKGFDTAGPIGPWLVTTDEIRDPQVLDMRLDVNGKRMQSGNTRTMIFDCAKIISHVSQYMTLMPGDIICTGTPPGVGLGIKPTPVFLKPGDVMTLGIQGLGEQRQKVVPYSA